MVNTYSPISSVLYCLVGRVALNPLLYKDPLYCLPPLFQILSNPPTPPSLFPATPIPIAYTVVLFLCLNGWLQHNWCAILLNDIIDIHMLRLRTLMHVLCNKASSFVACIGVSIPPLQRFSLPFLPKPYLESISVFRVSPPKSWIFQWTPIIFHL